MNVCHFENKSINPLWNKRRYQGLLHALTRAATLAMLFFCFLNGQSLHLSCAGLPGWTQRSFLAQCTSVKACTMRVRVWEKREERERESVCVCEGERERGREGERERGWMHVSTCVCVWACMCSRPRTSTAPLWAESYPTCSRDRGESVIGLREVKVLDADSSVSPSHLVFSMAFSLLFRWKRNKYN